MEESRSMNHALAVLCLGGFIAAAALDSNQPTDWALVSGDEIICAKSEQVCRTALNAIARGWWTPFAERPATCVPYPNCFPPRENFIKGKDY